MRPRRVAAALAAPLAFATAVPASAQQAPLPPSEVPQSPAVAQRDGGRSATRLIAAEEVGDGIEVGVGRFGVGEIARMRTNIESERDPAGLNRRNRGIAGVGLRISF